MKITIEVSPLYADAITFTLIGHGGGFTHNIASHSCCLENGTNIKMVMDNEINCHFEQKQENITGGKNDEI